ncbi:MAG: hypothetical protein ABFE07_27475 [Armatimonadia bacterium]
MQSQLTGLVKSYAFGLGADLVGVANIERYDNAPLMMSPKGIFPEARSVVVCALHHPDGCIEMGGRKHPQDMGPYAVQGLMNTHLDHISYEMARHLEDLGYEAIPIAASNIWRYRNYKGLSAVFAPDMSHIYSAVAAGLTELGYHGISMSPEFGPRNRFVSIITTAELDPTPLLPGNTLCDNCNQCVKHCLAGALSEEVDGLEYIEIEGRKYNKAKKSLWRCSWGEHFGVDLDLPKPDVVTEEKIIQTIREKGLRGGEMGSCLRHCLPPHLRYFDKEYTNAPRRKRIYARDEQVGTPGSFEWEMPRYVQEEMTAKALASGIDFVLVHDEAALQAMSFDFQERLPDAVRAVTMGVLIPKGNSHGEVWTAGAYFASRESYLGARKLEDLGYSVVVCSDLPQSAMAAVTDKMAPEGWEALTATFLTSAPLVADDPAKTPDGGVRAPALQQPKNLTRALKQAAEAFGCDQVGIASPARLAELKKQLAPIFDGEKTFGVTNKGKMWLEFEAEVVEETRQVKDAYDYLPDAQSVVVLGLRIPAATTRRVAQPPAEVVGPYVFAQYVVQWILREKALSMVKWLSARGYKAEITMDLMATGSISANPRGPQRNAFSNRFAAVAAGLGAITKGGFVATEDFGTNMRYVSVITDAPLKADDLLDFQSLLGSCSGCDTCMTACPPEAYLDEIAVSLEGQPIKFHRLDQKRCDWCARYALMGGDGFKHMGVDKDIFPPKEITAEALAKGFEQFDTVQGHHRCGVESCVVNCPLSRQSGD